MPKTKDYFKNKTLFVTGAASGIGRATALIFARENANIICTDINEAGGKATVQEIQKIGGQAIFIKTDVTSRAEVRSAIKAGTEHFGSIQFLFHSAGAALARSKFLDISDELFDKTFDLNVKGTFYCMQEILPQMLEQGKGVIVNMASMAHKRGGPGTSVHYASAKGAVVTMTMGVAREYADRGIRCLSISPGSINTPFLQASNTSPEMIEKFRQDIPMKRFAEPEEIGELVLFMCSDACEFMTADTVCVSGGGGWR
jgi:3-oxoacyl-[acyl-carrier protein] reductase